jgi:hypothetical protein
VDVELTVREFEFEFVWTTAPKYEYCPECCHEMDKIEGE